MTDEQLRKGIMDNFKDVEEATIRFLINAYREDPINAPKTYSGLWWIGSTIREFNDEERKRSIERQQANGG